MKHRTADQILRDLVDSGVLPNFHSAICDEARAYVDAQIAADLARRKRERADAEARERRAEREKRRLGGYEIAPRLEDGTDFGVDGLVLARNASGYRLVWRPGHKYWSAGHSLYAPAELQILIPGRRTSEKVRGMESGGHRLTADRILRCAAHINDSFGFDAAHRIVDALKTKRTVIP